ncbi:MAG TPA: ABC transporter substrate-binding protein [Actinomycetota bacterium]
MLEVVFRASRARRRAPLAGAAAVAMMVAAACSGGSDAPRGGSGPAQAGGIYRVGYQNSFGFTDGFDPSGEYLNSAWGIYSNLMIRTLVGYNHVAGPAGNEIVADLATEVPEPTDGGRTYTFRLKKGITFGPPVSRAITSDDVVYAMERIANKNVAAQYGYYYTPAIEGMREFASGDAETITGIETPDDRTIVFHLVEPAGDFLYRMAMPAAGPIPREVGECFEQAGQYGRYVVSSGPYMIQGADEVDASSCNSMEPMEGFNPNRELILVRNPDYDPATDSPEARESLPDEFHFLLNSNVKDIFAKVQAGELEDEIAKAPAQVLREYSTDPELEPFLEQSSSDSTWYLSFVLTEPPFDDVHVRRAVNLVMDKEGLRRAWGGPVTGDIATHVMPPSITGGHPTAEEYDPYPSSGFSGDVEAARAEMALSRYDADGDGICDAPACKDVLHFTRNSSPWTDMVPIEETSLERIGITLVNRELEDFYTPWSNVPKSSPIASGGGWGKDYADPSTFEGTLFHSSSIARTGNTNTNLVGITPEIAAEVDAPGDISDVPSVDADIDRCSELRGDERQACWVDLDKRLMEEVVPWVPYLWPFTLNILSDSVTRWEFDQFSGVTAFAHVAVDRSRQRGL